MPFGKTIAETGDLHDAVTAFLQFARGFVSTEAYLWYMPYVSTSQDALKVVEHLQSLEEKWYGQTVIESTTGIDSESNASVLSFDTGRVPS